MSSAFVVFGVGASVSILVFLLELLSKRIHYQGSKVLKIDNDKSTTENKRQQKEFFDLKYFW